MHTPSENPSTPQVVLPPVCAEKCRHLPAQRDQAVVRMSENPDITTVVICEKKKFFGCGAMVFTAGMYVTWGSQNDQRVLLPNPGVIETYPTAGSVGQRIERAKANGAVEI